MKPPRPRVGLLRRSGLLSLLLRLDGLQGQAVVIKDHVYVAIGKANENYVQCIEYGALVEAGPVATVIGDPAQVRVLGNRQEVQLTEEPERKLSSKPQEPMEMSLCKTPVLKRRCRTKKKMRPETLRRSRRELNVKLSGSRMVLRLLWYVTFDLSTILMPTFMGLNCEIRRRATKSITSLFLLLHT